MKSGNSDSLRDTDGLAFHEVVHNADAYKQRLSDVDVRVLREARGSYLEVLLQVETETMDNMRKACLVHVFGRSASELSIEEIQEVFNDLENKKSALFAKRYQGVYARISEAGRAVLQNELIPEMKSNLQPQPDDILLQAASYDEDKVRRDLVEACDRIIRNSSPDLVTITHNGGGE